MQASRAGHLSVACALVCALAACSEGATPSAPASRAEPARVSTHEGTGRAAREPASAEEALATEDVAPPSLWPEELPPIAEDLARPETRDVCAVRIRTSLAAEVAESIAGLGYDRFVEDLCGGLAAVREGDESACDALSVSPARSSCRRRLALVHARPDACPEDPSVSGREPVCLAWAARDVGLCRGAATGERERCEAVLAGDARRCRMLPAELRARCSAEVSRYGAALGRDRARSAARDVETRLALTLSFDARGGTHADAESGDAAAAPAPLAISQPTLERGVVLARCADGVRVRIGDARRHGAPLRLDGPAEAQLLLRFPPDAAPGPVLVSASAADAAIQLHIPHASDVSSDPGGSGSVTLEAHALTRGALLAGTVELTMPMPGGRGRVTGTFRTFVRDVLGADAEECTH